MRAAEEIESSARPRAAMTASRQNPLPNSPNLLSDESRNPIFNSYRAGRFWSSIARDRPIANAAKASLSS
jgi:hypothetical protein